MQQMHLTFCVWTCALSLFLFNCMSRILPLLCLVVRPHSLTDMIWLSHCQYFTSVVHIPCRLPWILQLTATPQNFQKKLFTETILHSPMLTCTDVPKLFWLRTKPTEETFSSSPAFLYCKERSGMASTNVIVRKHCTDFTFYLPNASTGKKFSIMLRSPIFLDPL